MGHGPELPGRGGASAYNAPLVCHARALKAPTRAFGCASYFYYAECLLKIFALCCEYFRDGWCQFDFFLVCSALLDQVTRPNAIALPSTPCPPSYHSFSLLLPPSPSFSLPPPPSPSLPLPFPSLVSLTGRAALAS